MGLLVHLSSAFLAGLQTAVTAYWPYLCAVCIILPVYWKNLPLVWHLRLLVPIVYHTKVKSSELVTHESFGGRSVFGTVVISTYSPLAECDINMHKSNATYLTDLDISRMHLMCKLMKGLPAAAKAHGRWDKKATWALGAASCHWLRQIKPYEAYQVHSRALTWDQKWLYIVSHFVPAKASEKNASIQVPYASAISKVVFKVGRMTVPPEEILRLLMLLPPVQVKSTLPEQQGDSPWNRDAIEQQRQKGLKLAVHFAALDELHAEFASSEKLPSLGSYGLCGRKL